tara:strand:- start:441 stop:659 length:219 start_codon:yes stop_codon:yes gene_type:complete
MTTQTFTENIYGTSQLKSSFEAYKLALKLCVTAPDEVKKNKALEIAEMLEKQVSETGIEQARNEVEKELTDD